MTRIAAAIALRLAAIADDPSWPDVYRMEAADGEVGRDGELLNPRSLSDDDVEKALHARILARAPKFDPNAKPPTPEEIAANNRQVRDDLARRFVGDHPDAPDPDELGRLLTVARTGATTADTTTPVGRFAATHGYLDGGKLTVKARMLLRILGYGTVEDGLIVDLSADLNDARHEVGWWRVQHEAVQGVVEQRLGRKLEPKEGLAVVVGSLLDGGPR